MLKHPSDDKDKIFANVINKEPIAVIIQTTKQQLKGKIFIRSEEQLSDEINRPSLFLELSDVTVYENDQQIYSSDMVAINRNQIVWILPGI